MELELEEAAREVHNELGAGWTETIYHSALSRELSERGIAHNSEGTVPVLYKGAPVGRRRPDMFVVDDEIDGQVIVEMKAGSTSGMSQLSQYLELLATDENYDSIIGGAVIRFNDSLEFEYVSQSAFDEDQLGLKNFE